jgi:hypothetical protein
MQEVERGRGLWVLVLGFCIKGKGRRGEERRGGEEHHDGREARKSRPERDVQHSLLSLLSKRKVEIEVNLYLPTFEVHKKLQ